MRESETHFILQGVLKLITPTRSVLRTLIKLRGNGF